MARPSVLGSEGLGKSACEFAHVVLAFVLRDFHEGWNGTVGGQAAGEEQKVWLVRSALVTRQVVQFWPWFGQGNRATCVHCWIAGSFCVHRDYRRSMDLSTSSIL